MPLSSPRFKDNKRFVAAAENKPPINYGETGEPVRILQQSLIELGYWMDISTKKFNTPDGIFGPETRDRVKSFQSGHSLFVDGVVGKDTMAKLDTLLPNAGPTLPKLPKTVDFTHRVKIHLRSLSDTAIAMSHQEHNCRMVYAQYGIYIDVRSGMSMNLTAAEQKAFLDIEVDECQVGKVSKEMTELHKVGLDGVSKNEIVCYFAKTVTDNHGKGLNGCASSTQDRPAVVVSSTSSQWTLGHEIGHVILEPLRPTHMTDVTNLMNQSTNAITANPPGLTPEQIKFIKASPFAFTY